MEDSTNWAPFFILALFPVGLCLVILANKYTAYYERNHNVGSDEDKPS
jgi:Ni/Fe-hydrogenase subunit HybB-like protein